MEAKLFTATAALISLLIAVMSGLGIGSGGLLVIWLTVFLGIAAPAARALNLTFFVFSASAALAVNLKNRRVRPKDLILPSFFALSGAFLGSLIGSNINDELLRQIFGVFLIFAGVRTLVGRSKGKRFLRESSAREKNILKK